MRKLLTRLSGLVAILLFVLSYAPLSAQDTTTLKQKVVDVVWLKDGSKLSGTIIKWELARGMSFKLITGAEVQIPKDLILKVYQDIPFGSQSYTDPMDHWRGPKPYRFKEEGFYNTFSAFLNFSQNGGAGIHYSAGHRFSRLLGVGVGIGFESNDFFYTRNIVPIYAEARGFFVPQKISPYYALKIGYGFALRSELSGTIDAKGGLHFSPELGVRFGCGKVNYFMGLEYKIQNATFTNNDWWGGGIFTDQVSYRRTELRLGIIF